MVVGDLTSAVDVVVLGAGPGGCAAALRAAHLGRVVAIVDPEPLGGTLGRAGFPAQALLTAAAHVAALSGLAELGITAGGVRFDAASARRHAAEVAQRRSAELAARLERLGVERVGGTGRFTGPREVRVATETGSHRIAFEQCVIAVGAAARPLPGLPFDGRRVLTPAEALRLDPVPPALTVIGADAVAAELATLFARLGSRVRLRLTGARLLPEFETCAGRLVGEALGRLGVAITTHAADGAERLAQLDADTDAAAPIVVSAGLAGRTADLDLDRVGLVPAAGGWLPVDARRRTANPAIYAVGDVTGEPPIAGLASRGGCVAAETIAGLPAQLAPQAIPRVARTQPAVAAVGLAEAEARAHGYDVVVARHPFVAAVAWPPSPFADEGVPGAGESADGPERAPVGGGQVIVVAERGSGVVLGVTAVGAGAVELIGEAALALELGATLVDLADTLHPWPGPGAALQAAALAAVTADCQGDAVAGS